MTLLDHVPEEGIVVTKHGRPVARLVPVQIAPKGKRVTLPLLDRKGKTGQLQIGTETPYDLIFD